MKEAVLSLKIPSHWIFEVAQRFDASIKVLDRKPYESHGVMDLVEISALEENLAEVIDTIQNLNSVHKTDIQVTDKGKAIGSVASKCFACRSLSGSNCFLTSARSKKDGRVEWNLIFANKDDLNKLIDNLKEYDIEVELNKICELEDKKALTARQQQIIQIAYEQGYFEFPRKVGVSELAKRLGISKSTLAEILRRGESKIIDGYFRGGNK
jgi:predicted DNA binding protein